MLIALCAALAPLAMAQNAPDAAKKLYCWNENGQRVCSDALPAEAVNRAREEINARSGMRTGGVDRALTEEERALAASDEQQRQVDQAAADTRRRTEQALLSSYQTEEELRRVFNERTGIVDNSIRTARYNVASLREGLVSLLRTAGDQELAGKPVVPKIADSIASRHRELQRQRLLQASFERQRVELDAEIADILRRYRELKGIEAVDANSTAAVASVPAK
ncbi:F0F1-type ATP synthase membrane subunit b/b' [Pseudoxanthomonas sacheonensis]|uniref:F0F1-type ATP synthase membrane subunit b/b n=1 Tax=Pseudoxanthomonas sacheonensis TaxID=443615 RepID=A0ABU1RTE1_9GAMM|nr:F0F1-type ATP synthase membrane subunit b/b' [Pseudoxanthomonas sacheonensis]